MSRLRARGLGEVGLREVLLEDALSLRDRYGVYDPDFWAELSKPVNQLIGGEAYQLRRYELPVDHPERRVGQPSDVLVLTEDNRLMPSSG